MREIRLYSSEGGEVLNPLSLPLSRFAHFLFHQGDAIEGDGVPAAPQSNGFEPCRHHRVTRSVAS